MNLARRLAEARLAAALLTRIPVGRLPEPAPGLSAARWAYPFAGLPVGLVGWLAQQSALALDLAALPAALIALGAMTLLTGALHFDGLADYADGLGGGRDRAHRLEIMRDSRIGSYGVLALIFAVSLQATALAAAPEGAPLLTFLVIAAASRLAMLPVLDLLPPARAEGLGRMASAPERIAGWRAAAAWTPGIALVAALAGASLTLMGFAPSGWAVPIALAAMAVAALAAARLAWRGLGGQTGDVLGATQVIAETAGWIAFAAAAA